MKTTRNIVTLLMAILMVLSSSIIAFAAPYGEVREYSAEEQNLMEEGQQIIDCDNGSFPKNVFDICEQLMEIDPELAEKAYRHIESVSTPIEANLENIPESTAYSLSANESKRNGIYVRDGDEGFFVYENSGEIPDITAYVEDRKDDSEMVASTSIAQRSAITNPQNNRLTSTICKLVVNKNGTVYHASGFFVGNTVIATAAHVLYSNSWNDFSSGWIDGGYVMQAYNPSGTVWEPYTRMTINSKQMVVGADWKNRFGYDDDWGVFVLNSGYSRQGAYTPLMKKQIDVSDYSGRIITTYGYPGFTSAMQSIGGRSTTTPSEFDTYRVLFGLSSSGGAVDGFEEGMSGGPVLDSGGCVVGIFTGTTKNIALKRSMAVSLDKWLYPALKKYE